MPVPHPGSGPRTGGLTAPVLVLAAAILAGAAPPARATDPAIQDLVTQVTQTHLAAHVQRLQDFRTRHSATDSVVAAANWLIEQYRSFGYAQADILEHPFVASGRPQRNIVVTKTGVSNPDDIIIIGGHYDSTSNQALTNAPGADDDGSGTAGVLVLAEILAGVPLDATVMFANWAAEEQGLLGSAAFVTYAFNQGFGSQIRLYMNLDACGYQGDPDNVVKLMTDPLTPIYNDQLTQLCLKYTDLVPAPMNPINFSDHASFRARSIPYTYSIEDDITPFIHTPNDLLSTIDLAYFQEIVQTNLAGLVTFAGFATTGVAEPTLALAPAPALRLAGPNPSRGPAALELDLPSATAASVVVYDVAGRHIATLLDGIAGPGAVSLAWDGRDARGARLPAGVYIARLAAGATSTVKLVLAP